MKKLNLSRRNFIETVAYGSGLLLVGGISTFYVFKDGETAEKVYNEIKKIISGKVTTKRVILKQFSYDFGNAVHKEPKIVVFPDNEDDIRKIFNIANKYLVPVAIRGAGHSNFGQTLCDGGIVIINRTESPEIEFNGKNVTVSTRTSWKMLEKQLNNCGLTSPVLTDYLDLTVGGTLSVGGYGLRSFRYGSQADNIQKMELILPGSSKTVECSNRVNRSLFNYSLSGLGQLGYISKVTIKPIQLKTFSKVFKIYFKNLDDFLSSLISLTDNEHAFDHLCGYGSPRGFIIEVAVSANEKSSLKEIKLNSVLKHNIVKINVDVVENYHMAIHNHRKRWVDSFGKCIHLWEDYVFTMKNYKRFLTYAIDLAKSQDEKYLPGYYLMVIANSHANQFPLSFSQVDQNNLLFSAGFYHMLPLGNNDALNKAKNFHNKCMLKCIALGGRPYLYGWHNLIERQKQAVYGEKFVRLKHLKSEYDPNNILNPGIFV